MRATANHLPSHLTTNLPAPSAIAAADSRSAGRVDPPSSSTVGAIDRSRYDPQAIWQRSLFIVPFMTRDSDSFKVVGNYKAGDRNRFEVRAENGAIAATLKRTMLQNGELVWMLPEMASIAGGNHVAHYRVSHGVHQGVGCEMRASLGKDIDKAALLNDMIVNLSRQAGSKHVHGIGMLKLIKDDHNDDFQFVTCHHEGKPVGVMVLEKMTDKETYLHHMVADGRFPGTAKAMMQQAATMAVARHRSGKLTLSPLNDRVAELFSKKYGFEAIEADSDDEEYGDDDDMLLKPNASPLWKKDATGGMVMK